MSVSGFSTHSSAESDESIAFSDHDEIPPRAAWFQCSSTFSRRKGAPKPSRTRWQGSAWSPLPGLTRMLQLVQRRQLVPRPAPPRIFPATTRRLPAVGWRTSTSLRILQMYCMFVLMRQGLQVMQTRFLQSLLHNTRVSGNRLLTGHDFHDLAQDNQLTARLFTSCRSRSPPAWVRSRAP